MHSFKRYGILIFFIACFAVNTEARSNQSSIDQLKQLLMNISAQYEQPNQSVYLGSGQVKIEQQRKAISQSAKNLLSLLNQKTVTSVTQLAYGLKWLDASVDKLPDPMVNAGSAASPLTICQVLFLGPRSQGKAIYPGQLTPTGCRITYGGYAFVVNPFKVMVGDNAHLKWIPIEKIIPLLHQNTQQNSTTYSDVQNYGYSISTTEDSPMHSLLFNYDLAIQGSTFISGGIQEERPVLICRVNQNGSLVIGKFIFFMGPEQRQHYACNIGIKNKEIVMTQNFELLFWQSPSDH